MAIKYIIDSDAVMKRMTLPDVDGVSETIDSHLTAAHVRFQSLLDTTFEPATKTDIFWINTEKFPQVVDKYFRLRLKKAFVKASNLVVQVSDDITFSSGTALSVPDYQISLEKGIVLISEAYGDKYVSVTYDSGFDAENKAPDWLKEAVLAYMPFLMNTQQATNRAKEQEGIAAKIADVSADMVAPYMRGTAFQYKPVF